MPVVIRAFPVLHEVSVSKRHPITITSRDHMGVAVTEKSKMGGVLGQGWGLVIDSSQYS